MARPLFIIVSDDYNQIQRARNWGQENGVSVNVYSSTQWTNGLEDSAFRTQLHTEETGLQPGNSGEQSPGATILPFRSPAGSTSSQGRRVNTINEVEKVAIETAIFEYKGNLTEAAKALGIGRATLYRKVKQYSINPAAARKKAQRAA